MIGKQENDCKEKGAYKVGAQHPVEPNTSSENGNYFRTASHFRCKQYHRDKYHQREDHRNDEWNKPYIIMRENIMEALSRFHKIVCALTGINYTGNNRKDQHHKYGGGQ